MTIEDFIGNLEFKPKPVFCKDPVKRLAAFASDEQDDPRFQQRMRVASGLADATDGQRLIRVATTLPDGVYFTRSVWRRTELPGYNNFITERFGTPGEPDTRDDVVFPDVTYTIPTEDAHLQHVVHGPTLLTAAALAKKADVKGTHRWLRGCVELLFSGSGIWARLWGPGRVSLGEDIRVGTCSNTKPSVGVQAHFLVDALRGVKGAVRLQTQGGVHYPLRLDREDGEIHVIMPMRT